MYEPITIFEFICLGFIMAAVLHIVRTVTSTDSGMRFSHYNLNLHTLVRSETSERWKFRLMSFGLQHHVVSPVVNKFRRNLVPENGCSIPPKHFDPPITLHSVILQTIKSKCKILVLKANTHIRVRTHLKTSQHHCRQVQQHHILIEGALT